MRTDRFAVLIVLAFVVVATAAGGTTLALLSDTEALDVRLPASGNPEADLEEGEESSGFAVANVPPATEPATPAGNESNGTATDVNGTDNETVAGNETATQNETTTQNETASNETVSGNEAVTENETATENETVSGNETTTQNETATPETSQTDQPADDASDGNETAPEGTETTVNETTTNETESGTETPTPETESPGTEDPDGTSSLQAPSREPHAEW